MTSELVGGIKHFGIFILRRNGPICMYIGTVVFKCSVTLIYDKSVISMSFTYYFLQ